jgi:hypothetical protein
MMKTRAKFGFKWLMLLLLDDYVCRSSVIHSEGIHQVTWFARIHVKCFVTLYACLQFREIWS